MEAGVDCHKSNVKRLALLLKTVKRMLFLGNILLRYILIYNLEVSFNFRLLFLQLRWLDWIFWG